MVTSMKRLTFPLFALILLSSAQAQERSFSLGIGYFGACPQNQLDDIGYDDGFGLNLNFLSRPYPIGSGSSWQVGMRIDMAAMDNRNFGTVPLNTPVADLAELKVSNGMSGVFGQFRYTMGEARLKPYIDLLVGFRSFNTKQTLNAMQPELNPDYEESTLYDKVVYTDRFAYGGSFGLQYRISKYVILESSITYTEGGSGAVMPLDDVFREGELMRYPHSISQTDMLLIDLGVRFQLYRLELNSGGSTTPSRTPSYRNTVPDTQDTRDQRDPTPDPPKKKLEVKPPTEPKKGSSKA